MQGLVRWWSGFESKVLLAFAPALLSLAAALGISWRVVGDAELAAAWVVRTHEVLSLLAEVRAGGLQIEYSTQSFRISGDAAHLAARDAALAARETQLQRLAQLVADNPQQHRLLGDLRSVVAQRQGISRDVERLRKQQGEAAAAAYVAQAPLLQTRERMVGLLDAMQLNEQRLLREREQAQAASRRALLAAVLLATLLMAALLVSCCLALRRQYRATVTARAALDRQNLLLEQRVEQRSAELRASERQLRGVIDNVPALVAFVDTRQRYVYANEQYRQRFAAQHSDITGLQVAEVLGEARYAIAAPMIARALAGTAQSYDWEPFEGVWQLIN